MSRHATGAFDQHGCPLIVFPVDGQDKLASDLSKAEVVDFINYFLCLHNKKQDMDSLVSVVADLRQASLITSRFITETLLLLELHKRTVHTVYLIQPKKKDVVKLLLRLLAPSKSCTAPFKKVLLKEISELSNYADRSQLIPSLGGYLIYCHQSWVAFIKEVDVFVQEFLSVVQRLPACISTLQTLSRLPVPDTFDELKDFCSTNEAKFQQLRRDLGLDELLRHCERVVEKLRYPEKESCYQAMAGTPLFAHTALDMLQNYSRITAAVDKVELLWQQAFSKARVQLQVFQLREEALQITERIETLLKEKLQPYRIEIAKDTEKAGKLRSEFEVSLYTPAMALVRCAEDVIHTLAETLVFCDGQTRESWVLDLERLKEKLQSAVEFPHQTLRAVSDFHHYYNKLNSWYSLVLCENFLHELLSDINRDPRQRKGGYDGTLPVWTKTLSAFLRRNPPPIMEELAQLAHLANVIPDGQLQLAGKQLAQRCKTLRKLLSSPGSVAFSDLQLALQWQYKLLRSSHVNLSNTDVTMGRGSENIQDGHDDVYNPSAKPALGSERHVRNNAHSQGSRSNLRKWGTGKEVIRHRTLLGTSPSAAVSGKAAPEGKPPSLSSFDSGFDGAGSSHLEAGGGREGWEGLPRLAGTRDSHRPSARQPQIHEENFSSVSDSEEHGEEFGFGSVGNSSRASIQIIPKITVDSFNFEIQVKRSAALPQNPWLSLPVDDLENSYTVTITQNLPSQQRDPRHPDPSEPYLIADQSSRSRDQPMQTAVSTSTQSKGPRTRDWILQSQSSFEDSEMSVICNVLSSTITDGKDTSNCNTEGLPTLLWDSYDLHDQNQDLSNGMSSSMIDVSLKDWAFKEQEGLKKVEEILERADGILEEEENVLVQEAVLDVLLRSEGRQNQWTLWDNEDQPGGMSSSDLAEAGVVGLEDCLVSVESENAGPHRSPGTASETEASEDIGRSGKGVGALGSMVPCSKGNLLTELKQVHILDELIVEENLKIHELRRCEKNLEEESPEKKPPDTHGPWSTSKERQVFRLKLEREKKEVQRMEKSLNKELDRDRKVKKRGSSARKVVRCSIMEKARAENLEDQALCGKLLSGSQSSCQNAQHLTSTVPHNSLGQDASKSNSNQTVLTLNTDKETTFQDLVPPVDPIINYNPKDLNSCVGEPTVPTITPLCRPSGLEEFTEDEGIQPQRCVHEKELDAESVENATTCKPEASLTLQMGPDDGAFDPGGKSTLPPVPKTRMASLSVNNSHAERETPHSTELVYTAVSSGDGDPSLAETDSRDSPPKPRERKNKPPANGHTTVLGQNVKEHSNNNNNNNPLAEKHKESSNDHNGFSESTEDGKNSTVAPVSDGQLQTDSELSQETEALLPADVCPNLQSSPQVSPDLPVTCDPGGRDDNVLDELQSYKTTRISTSILPTNQPQLNMNTREMSDFKTPIVLDTGSNLMKAGFADQDLPTIVFPTVIGLPKYEEIMNGNYERETYIGHEAQHMRGVLALKYPMKNGIIHNWDDMEKIWRHTFQQLNVDSDDHPVMLTEAAMNPRENRQRMVEVMFECFSVPFTYVAMQAVLALYAAGRSTGVVFDSGDGVSHSVPVFDGYCLSHAVQRFPLAGLDVTMHLKKLLQEQGVCMRTTAEMEIVREVKERCCRVALDYEAELACRGSAGGEMYYTMPDGQVICLGTERFRAPEILFKPELIGRDHYGMHESIFKSILSSDIDLRRGFLGNIVLSGGNTLLPGLPERLQTDIKGMVPSDLAECVGVTSPEDRDFSVWSGGAVLANLPSFSCAWISQEEYEEVGPQIVFRKCF